MERDEVKADGISYFDISIHALRMERDLPRPLDSLAGHISIHALRMERDGVYDRREQL